MFHFILYFLPELVLLLGALALFFVVLGHERTVLAQRVALGTALLALVAAALSLGREAVLFGGATGWIPFPRCSNLSSPAV